MGKRRNQQPPGGDGKRHVPKMKPSPPGDPGTTGDSGCETTAPAHTGDADGTPTSQEQATHGSAGTNSPRSTGDAGEVQPAGAVGEPDSLCGTAEKGGDAGSGGGTPLPEPATEPDSPQQANSVVDGTEEDGVMVTGERDGSPAEELAAQSPIHRGTGDSGASPDRGHTREGAAGGGDAPGRTVVQPEECEGHHHECQGVDDQHQEPPPAPVVRPQDSGAASGLAGGEHREDVSREQPQATPTSDTVKDVAEPWGVSTEDLGVGTPLADPKLEDGTAEPGTTGTGSQPRGGDTSPRPSSVPDPAGSGGLAEEEGMETGHGAEDTGSLDTAPPTGAVIANSVTVTPESAPTGITHPPTTAPQDEPSSAREQPDPCCAAEGNHLELPPQQEQPGCKPRAEEENHPAQPRDKEEDATDVVCGLILELSNLNRLAMSAHRGLEALRRPKPRRGRRPAPQNPGRRWKEM